MSDSRRCSKCGEVLSIAAFGRRRYKDRWIVLGQCKECVKRHLQAWRIANPEKTRGQRQREYWKDAEHAREIARKWAKKNRAKVLEKERRYAKANPEKMKAKRFRHYWSNPAKARTQKRNQYQKHAQERREYQRVRRASDPKRFADERTKWGLANPERVKAIQTNYRARKRNALGEHSADDLIAIRQAQKNKCAVCRERMANGDASLDHIVPLSKGGSNWPRNLQFLCRLCNSKKNARDQIDFMRSQGMLI